MLNGSAKAAQIHGRKRTSGAGGSLCRRNLLNRQFGPTAEKPGQKGINWHWLRHATASLLYAAGASLGTVQMLLGHSSSEVTREHYIDVASESRSAMDQNAESTGSTQIDPNAKHCKEGSSLVH
jgi:integrase